jgi:hypothetical protein
MTSEKQSTKTILTLAQAAQLLPHRPNAHTLWRWSTRGLRGVKLKTFKVGRSHCTTAEMLAQFIRESGLPGDQHGETQMFEL